MNAVMRGDGLPLGGSEMKTRRKKSVPPLEYAQRGDGKPVGGKRPTPDPRLDLCQTPNAGARLLRAERARSWHYASLAPSPHATIQEVTK